MADGIDAKGIGFGAKDVVMGVLGAVAGGFGGAPGAAAVDKADKGIDKLIGAAGGPTSRADKMDQADKPPARKKAAPTPGSAVAAAGQPPDVGPAPASPPPPPAVGPPPASPEEIASSQQKPGEVNWPPEGDGRVTADFLIKQGYSREQVRQILSGAEGQTVAQVTQGPPQEVEGTRIAHSDARPVKRAQASSVPMAAAQPTVLVRGARVADSSAVPIVEGRRIDKKGGPQTA